jgi:hypothetical protein
MTGTIAHKIFPDYWLYCVNYYVVVTAVDRNLSRSEKCRCNTWLCFNSLDR